MPSTRACSQCKEEKHLSAFYKKVDGRDGFDTFCKACRKAYFKKRYAEKYRKRAILPDGYKFCPSCKKVLALAEFDRNAGRHDGVQIYCRRCWKQYQKFYRRNPEPRFLTSKKVTTARQRPDRAFKDRARAYVSLAVKFGDLVRKPCEVLGCGDIDVQAHHDDYTKPLAVRWLCVQHHNALHKEENR